jgi:hypothetical protein
MKSEVYRVYCTAGMPITRTPESPVKVVTVYFPEDVLRKLSSPEVQAKAIQYAKTLLQEEIVNDPHFKSGCGWGARKELVDLSDYATPNLEARDGVKAWLN